MYLSEEEIVSYLTKIEDVLILKENLFLKKNKTQIRNELGNENNDGKENMDFFSFKKNITLSDNFKLKEEELRNRELRIEKEFERFQEKVNVLIRNKNKFLEELNKKDEELKIRERHLNQEIEKIDNVSFRIMSFIDRIFLEENA